MRFNITALILASGLASAVTTAPPVVMEGNNTSLLQLNKAIVESNQLPPNCNLGSCLNLGGEITCIASAAASGDAVALQKCLANSISQLCGCIACVPFIANVLSAIGFCPAHVTVHSS